MSLLLDNSPEDNQQQLPLMDVRVYRLEAPVVIGGKIHQRGIWTVAYHRPDLEESTWQYKQSLVGPLWEPEEEGIAFSKSMLCAILNHDDHRHTWLPRKELMVNV